MANDLFEEFGVAPTASVGAPASADLFAEFGIDVPALEQDGALIRGVKRATNSARSAYNLATGDAETGAQLAADRAAYEKANPGTPAGNELMAAWQRGDGALGGMSEVASEMKKDWQQAPTTADAIKATGENLSAMGGGIVEQIPNMVAPMVGMGAGALAGAPAGPIGVGAGMWAGASAGNTAMESAEKVDQALRAAGIDPADKPAVTAFLQENGSSILGQAAVKGSIIGLVDTITMKLGSKLLLGPAEAATARAIESLGLNIADKAAIKAAESQIAAQVATDPVFLAAKTGTQGMARNVATAALEPAGEFAGEFVGEGVATGDWDTKNAALEALSAVGQGAITFAGQKAYDAATSPLRKKQDDAALEPTTGEMDEANAAIDLPLQQFTDLPGQVPLLSAPTDVIEVPTNDGGSAQVSRADGPISAAVVDTLGEMVKSGMPLRAFASQMDAQADLDARPDAARFRIASHPRTPGRFAVVPRTAQELAAIDAKAAAGQEAEVRQAQLEQEEGTRTQQAKAEKDNQALQKKITQLHMAAKSVENSVTTNTPPGDAAIAREHAADLRTQAKELQAQLKETKTDATQPAQVAAQEAQTDDAEAAQAELTPAVAQPVAEMPGLQRIQQNRQAAARAQAEARGAQLVDDEVAGTNTEPTEAQIAAGNYQKGHAKIGPLDISIENPVGSSRSGIENGKKWQTKMSAHYGYLKRTTGNDGDQVDVYVKAGTPTDHTGPVYVIDQFNPKTGAFDEHKAMLGYASQAEAEKAYDAHFSDKSGPKRRKATTAMAPAAFKSWAQNGDTTQPVVQVDEAQAEIAQSTGAKFARKRGESMEDYQRRMADEKNAKKAAARGQAQATDAAAEIRDATGVLGTIVKAQDLPNAPADGLTRQAAEFMTKVAKLFGKNLVIVEDLAGADGFYRSGNNLFVSTQTTTAHLRVLGHEMLHALKNQAPQAYAAMLKAVSGIATDAQLRAQVKDYFADKKNWSDAQIDAWLATPANKEMITEEWMADLSGNRWAESSFWESVFAKVGEQHDSETAKGIIAQLKAAITNALNKLMLLVKGDAFAVDQRVAADLEQIREALAQGFADYAKAVKDKQAVDQGSGAAKFAKPTSDNGHKRTSKGEYVGAPAGMTSSKLGALRTRLRALAKEGEPGRFWYEESSDLILAAAEGDKILAEKIAGLLAIYSPQATVSANTSMGLKALYQWMNGDPIKARFGAQDKKAQAWMDGTIAEQDALQIKTGNFFKNLMRKIDEDRYGFEKQGATIDMWMARVFGYGSKAIGSEARYYFAERETKRIAEELGWEPQQVQAALWVAIKSRIEAIADDAREIAKTKGWVERKVVKAGGKENISWPPLPEHREAYEGLILKMALAQDADPSGLLKAAYHFGTALKERTGQISWEAMPGKTTGVLPGIFQAPLAQQTEYLVAMDQALRDENGQDLIAKKLGLPVIGTAMGPSAWQMAVGAGAQTEVAISTERDQNNKKVSVSAPARNLLNTYAAIRGYVLSQEAVVWHFPIFSSSKKDANGIQLDFGRDPTHDEVVSLYNAIHDVSGRDDWAPAYVPGVGVRLLNFSDVPHVEFHKLVKQAAAKLPADVTIHFDTFQSDGDYIANDWQENPDGSDYRSRFSGSGRSDLQGWVESELRPRAEHVNQKFAEKYGWGKASFSTKRSDAASDGRDGGLAAQGSGEVRGYGTSQPGSVTVQGIHYSQQERANLDGRYYGTGMRGAEGPRVRAAADPRIKERVYFYINKGTGVRPEDGVGAIAHTAQLNNVYDGNADTWVQSKVDPSLKGDAWMSAFESAVIDNGFDGYVTDFGTQRAAVLLGRHSVAVSRSTGQGAPTQAAPKTETPVTDRVAAARNLPMGRMTGAEWKRLIPEAKMLADEQGYYKDDVVGQLRQAKLSTKRFYSQLERQIEAAPDKVFGQAKQVSNWLVANAGKLGIKQEEIQWTGITDWLAMQQKVSKADVLGYLAQNGVQVEEVEKGDKHNDDYEWGTLNDEHPDGTKYGQYVLPGGDNYRELLLTLPDDMPRKIRELQERRAEIENPYYANGLDLPNSVMPAWREINQQLKDLQGDKRPGFRSAHWDEANILAHVRFNDRTDAEGNKVLFIEELQSDWGQRGKKEGFGGTERAVPDGLGGWKLVSATGVELVGENGMVISADTEAEALSYIGKGVPSAPFVTDTKSWLGLGLKRMIAYAVENGYDKVAFVNGEQSAQRYDLSKQIDRIEYYGDQRLIAYGKGGSKAIDQRVSPEALEDYIGKDAATKLMEQPPVKVDDSISQGMAVRDKRVLKNADLKVGGEGMKTFYDKIVPQTLNEVLKRVGGGKVESVSIEGEFSDEQKKQFNSAYATGTVADVAAAKAMKKPRLEQLGFTITPELAAKVEQGMPLFSLKRRINDTIQKVDAAVDGLSNLPNQFDYLKDRYLALGKIARVDEISAEVRKAFSHASDADKKAVYDYLTTAGATTARVTDPALKAIAKRIKDTINYTGDQLVARGLLDQQARDHYRDQYLPRMYLRHLLDDNSAKVIGMGKKPSDLGYLKHRKDIPVEIREVVLGEVKDPSFLSVNAIGRAMRDISLMDWMGKISQNNDWVFPEVFAQWRGRRVTAYWLRAEADRIERQAEHYTDPVVKQKAVAEVAGMRTLSNTTLGNMQAVDHKVYKQIPDTMRYGLLRGMWVRREIFDDIMGASQIVNADPTWFEDWFGFGGKGTKLTQWWKFTKVALNPPGQIRNFISNMVMLQLSGVGLHKLPFRLIEAARDISSNGPYWKIAKKYGVTESTFTAQELFRVKRDLVDMEAKIGNGHPLRFLMSAGATFLEKVSDLYQFSEALGKTIKIIDEMKNGKSEAEAAIEAQKWLFDYSLVPQSVRIARNAPVGLPFITYQIKVLPRLLEVATKYPWRFLPWAGLLYGMQAAVAAMFGVDDDELKKLKKSLPEWLQDRGHTVFLPMRDADGRLQVADVGYFFPWTFYTQIAHHAADGKVKKALVDDIGGMFSAPILGGAAALMSNYDTFSHKPIYNESDPVSYQAASIANYAYDLMAPPFLSSHGVISPMGLADKKFGGKLVQAEMGTTNKFGDPKATEAQAIGALFGANFYGMDPEHTRITNMQVMNGKVRDAERALRQRLMDRGLSDEARGDVMRDYQARMIELQQEMVEYAKESEVPQQLRVLKRQ